jgi:hypothetical protein
MQELRGKFGKKGAAQYAERMESEGTEPAIVFARGYFVPWSFFLSALGRMVCFLLLSVAPPLPREGEAVADTSRSRCVCEHSGFSRAVLASSVSSSPSWLVFLQCCVVAAAVALIVSSPSDLVVVVIVFMVVANGVVAVVVVVLVFVVVVVVLVAAAAVVAVVFIVVVAGVAFRSPRRQVAW